MNRREPPALATRLLSLSHWVKQNPSLVGDLQEQYQAGRSRAWYWRQTVSTMITGLAAHPSPSIIYAFGLILGWVFQVGFVTTIWLVLPTAFYKLSLHIQFAALLISSLALTFLFEKGWKALHLGNTPLPQAMYRTLSLYAIYSLQIFVSSSNPVSLYELLKYQLFMLCLPFIFEVRNIRRGTATKPKVP